MRNHTSSSSSPVTAYPALARSGLGGNAWGGSRPSIDYEAVKAVVVERPGEVSYRDVQDPVCGPDDVLVRSHRAGVCRTDIELATGIFTDPRWVRFPCIPGHEWVGTVAETGDGVTDLARGEKVVCEGLIPCARCRRCRAGETHLCENLDALGFTRGGGFGEYVLAPRRVVHRLPEHVSLETAVLVEPTSVVLRGLERARPVPGETVGVIGIGSLGAIAIRLAKLLSPAAVIAYGIRDEELELARLLGADGAVNVAAEAPGEGELDLVVECAGSVAAVELATRLVREGGRAVLLGITGEGATLELPADRIALRDVSLLGSVAYTSAVWAQVVSLLGQGLLDLDAIVTHRFPIEEFEAAFALMDSRDGVVGKVVLEHSLGETA
ncbi:MAG: dehydrogenase [Candidatus Rokuibacteriota bacterium]|nr:MAG: dehydrogenase [Candidatus Rokubacteria bacterium]